MFVEAFERIVHALPHDPQFAALEIVQALARPGRHETQLTVMVDREGGVDMVTCERVAARVNASLDAFSDPYTLEVGSAGLNRPLVRADDYERFAGRAAKVVTTTAIANAKTHRGTIAGLRGDTVVLQQGESETTIPLAAIKAANLEYDIRADLARAKREKASK